jgi:hypothetical protein
MSDQERPAVIGEDEQEKLTAEAYVLGCFSMVGH